MLINSLDYTLDSEPTVLQKLDNLPIKFYLTGSKYFNEFREIPRILTKNTDYDYFCEYYDDVLQMLRETLPDGVYRSVKEIKGREGYYTDKNIAAVFCVHKINASVDIQLVKNLELKIEVQRILAAMGDICANCKKSQQRWLWDSQYERICKERNLSL